MKDLGLFSLLLACVAASPTALVKPRDDEATAVVNFAVTRGESKRLASGFIYGIPDTPNQIPDQWYTDFGFNYGRAGGAQLGAPNRGWIWNEYEGRLASTLSNYWTCRKYGARFILLPHDVWGTDGSNSTTVWPGDNGDWTDYDNFVHRLMADLKSNGALEGLDWEIWNEPDIGVFWQRSSQQWTDLYIHTHKLLREDPDFDTVQIQGPSLAFRPTPDNTWWQAWLSQIAGNNTIPDQYAFHIEGTLDDPNNDLEYTNASLAAALTTYGLPDRQININEYGNPFEQVPAGAAWWISRLERYDAIGLRGNWAGGTTLHDLFANAITKIADPFNYAATDYAPAPEYNVYKYYNTEMTGVRASTTGSGDRILDVYATIGTDKARILCGARVQAGLWYIRLENLSSIGLPTDGTLTILTWGFDGDDKLAVASPPSNRFQADHTYAGNSLTFPIYQTDNHTAWAFEFNI